MRENVQRETAVKADNAAETFREGKAVNKTRWADQVCSTGGCKTDGSRATDGGSDPSCVAAVRAGASAKRASSRSVAYTGMTVALLAVSAWVAVPLGPVPFTLQTFVLAFAILVLRPSECIAALGAYLLLGAVGVPVFSGMRGGIGMLAGPTGGFLWGFLVGAVAALLVVRLLPPKGARSDFARGYAACLTFLLVSYACGWVQLVLVAGMGPSAAFLTAIAPFVVPDLVKLSAAVAVAQAVRNAVPSFRKSASQR